MRPCVRVKVRVRVRVRVVRLRLRLRLNPNLTSNHTEVRLGSSLVRGDSECKLVGHMAVSVSSASKPSPPG